MAESDATRLDVPGRESLSDGPRYKLAKLASMSPLSRLPGVSFDCRCPAGLPQAHRGRRALGEVTLLTAPDFLPKCSVSTEEAPGAGLCDGAGDGREMRTGILTGIEPEMPSDCGIEYAGGGRLNDSFRRWGGESDPDGSVPGECNGDDEVEDVDEEE